MKRILNFFAPFLVCLVLAQTTAIASSHREAPLISNDPLADNTDVYAFRSPCDTNKVILIANFIPFELPQGGPNFYTFGENIRYEIHVDNNPGTPGDDIIYRFTFQQQNQDSSTFFRIRLGKENWKTRYNLERSTDGGSTFSTILINGVVPPPNIGPRSIENSVVGLGAASYQSLMMNAVTPTFTGEKVFAGPIDDPFFVDLGGIFDVGNVRPDSTSRDGLEKFNCHSIVMEIPISILHRDGKNPYQAVNILDSSFIIGVYASASRPQISTFDPTGGNEITSGPWIQVSRLGMPLTNEAIIPIGQKDKWNFTETNNEDSFKKFFVNPELALYMDDSQFGGAVPGLSKLRIQTNSLGMFDFRNGKKGLFPLKGSPAVAGTALDDAAFGNYLLPDSMSPRAVDLLPIFHTGVPNLRPYQLATGKNGNPLAAGKPFINNFLPSFGDMLRLNMAVPVTDRNSPDFSSLGLVQAAVLGLTDSRFNGNANLEFIPNMDGFPNGRRLEDDVTRIELQAVAGVVLAAIGLWYDDYNGTGSPVTPQLLNVLTFTAGPTSNDTTFQSCFPFVQIPWRGFTGSEYMPANPLPVNYLSFTAEKQGNAVLLRWEVADQLNNDRFEVEHSVGGSPYKKIGTVASSDTRTRYEFYHPNPSLDKINYYRLKQVDNDGKFSYSAIRLVKYSGKNIFTITPNPATDLVRIFTDKTDLTIHLYDGAGKKVKSQIITNGTSEIDLRNLAKGTYLLVAEKNGVKVESKKFVKQ